MTTSRRWLLGLVVVLVVEGAVVVAISAGVAASQVIVPMLALLTAGLAALWWMPRHRQAQQQAQLRTWYRRGSDPHSLTEEFSRLSLQQLCAQWRTSTEELDKTIRVARASRLAGVRASLLDEIERRDPAGFQRWVSADPFRSDPADYVRCDDSTAR